MSEVRLILTQPVTTDLDDLDLFISRRADVCGVLAVLNGEIDAEVPPFVFTGRPWSSAWSDAFGPNF